MKNKKLLIPIGIIIGIGIILLCFIKFLSTDSKEKDIWQLPIKHLNWGMTVQEAEEHYELVQVKNEEDNNYTKLQIKKPVEVHDKETEAYLYFCSEADMGLVRIVGYFTEEEQGGYADKLRDIYGGYENYWDNIHVGEVYSSDELKKAYQGYGIEIDDKIAEIFLKKPLIYLRLDQKDNGECAVVMDAFMQVLMDKYGE